jgi:hypothetical protein
MKFLGVMIIGVMLIFWLFGVGGCSRFEAYDPVTGGVIVKTTGAPLLNRKDEFTVQREWLDENNVLHSCIVKRNTDENAGAQLKALELVKDAYESAPK